MKLTKKRLNKIIQEEQARLDEATQTPEQMIETARQGILEAMRKIEEGSDTGVLNHLEEAASLIALAQDMSTRKGLGGETYEKTLADYKKHPEWFN
jgi:hypothetical protein